MVFCGMGGRVYAGERPSHASEGGIKKQHRRNKKSLYIYTKYKFGLGANTKSGEHYIFIFQNVFVAK